MLSQATSQADSVQQRGVLDLNPQRKLSLLWLLGTEEEVRSQVLFSCIHFTFFQYLFISVSQVTDQQESLQRAYPVVPEQTPLLSKAAYVAGVPQRCQPRWLTPGSPALGCWDRISVSTSSAWVTECVLGGMGLYNKNQTKQTQIIHPVRVACTKKQYPRRTREGKEWVLFVLFLKQCSPGWPATCYLDQASLGLSESCLPLPPEC